MNELTARKAAKWWADQLRGSAPLDNGDDSANGGIVFAFAKLLQDIEKKKQPVDLIDKFENELTELLVSKNVRWVGVDYHPDLILSEAADRAGIPLGMTTLPWKTSMSFDGDKVRVSCGYGAAAVDLE